MNFYCYGQPFPNSYAVKLGPLDILKLYSSVVKAVETYIV